MRSSFIAVVFFVLGVLMARFNFIPKFLVTNDFTLYVLFVQMALIGVCMGAELNKSVRLMKKLNVKIMLAPFTAVIGTIFGIAIFSVFYSDLSLKDMLAVGSGFGYYSLSSVYITKIRGETLGVIALLANIVREIFSLLLTPILTKRFGKLAPIAMAGATSMDTCLPIIAKSVGKNYAVISVFSGTVLTILVPFLVTFILTF